MPLTHNRFYFYKIYGAVCTKISLRGKIIYVYKAKQEIEYVRNFNYYIK